MLVKADFPVATALEMLTRHGIEVALLVPTPTGLEKSIFDGDARYLCHDHRASDAGAGLGNPQQESSVNMNGQEGIAIAGVLFGLGAGVFLTAQRPSFWFEFATRLGKVLVPLAWRFASRRMPPEEEAAWRAAERRGQGNEWLRQRRSRQERKRREDTRELQVRKQS